MILNPPPPPPPVANKAECEVLVSGKDADGFRKIDIMALDDPEYREYVPLLLRALQNIARDTPTVELEARISYLQEFKIVAVRINESAGWVQR